jgi:phage-related tail protein
MEKHIAKITRKAAPIQDVNHPPIAKKTYTEKAASLVQNSAARWRAIQKHLRNNNQRSNKEEKYTKENTTRLRQRKRTQHKSTKQSVKCLKNLTTI